MYVVRVFLIRFILCELNFVNNLIILLFYFKALENVILIFNNIIKTLFKHYFVKKNSTSNILFKLKIDEVKEVPHSEKLFLENNFCYDFVKSDRMSNYIICKWRIGYALEKSFQAKILFTKCRYYRFEEV